MKGEGWAQERRLKKVTQKKSSNIFSCLQKKKKKMRQWVDVELKIQDGVSFSMKQGYLLRQKEKCELGYAWGNTLSLIY